MRFLLLGGTGQVGEEFRALALPKDVEVAAPSRAALDLEDPCAIEQMIAAQPWSAVINAAAYTDVDRAESEESVAFAVNAEAPSRLAAETGRRGIPLVHISTDYVFDGRKGAPERGVRGANRRSVILRTSWVYSPFRKNFVKTILRVAAERARLTVVADQRGCPTAARDIAQACLDIAMRCASEPQRAPYGIYHFAGAGEASWFEFASTIVDMAADRLGRSPQIIPIRTSEYPTPAVRAADTRLDCTAAICKFGVKRRPWRQALEDTIDRLLSNKDMP